MLAVRRDRHMVGAVAVHLEAPHHFAGDHVQRHHIREAGPRHHQQAAVVGAVHVVHVLVVALADQQAHALEEQQTHRVQVDLGDALAFIGDRVDGAERLIGLRVDHVDRAFPVIADEDHVAGLVGELGRREQIERPAGRHRRGHQHQRQAEPGPCG